MFQPSIPAPGFAGWAALQRSLPRQTEAFGAQQSVRNALDYFRGAIGDVAAVDDLVGDRRLLTVALGAFGLETEIDKKAIIRRVMSEGVNDPKSFANRINDPRWKAFAAAFSFADGTSPDFGSGFRAQIAARFIERGLEAAIGEVDPSMRLALNFKREIGAIARGGNVERIGWLQIMGSRPLRAVVEQALGLPASLASLDLERQKSLLEEKSLAQFGEKSPRAFLDPQNVETALRRYFARESAAAGVSASAPGAAALALLQGAVGSRGAAGLIASGFINR